MNNDSADIVVIGGQSFTSGFALAGVRKAVTATSQTALQEIAQHKDAGIIIVESSIIEGLSTQERESIETSVRPIIITLGNDKRGRLKQQIISTLGVDLLK